VLTACWSVKGGSGTTVVAASLVLTLASSGRPVVAADFAGDLPLVLGGVEPAGQGISDWLRAGPEVPGDALARLAHATAEGITLLAQGREHDAINAVGADAGARLAQALRAFRVGSPVVADCGVARSAAVAAFIEHADRSLLVLRPCYLALSRAVKAPRPTAVVMVTERRRALSVRDVEDVLGVPVVTEIAWEPEIASAVDGGLLSRGLPRRLTDAMRVVAA
jgi:MinD-like ATPase involved in chromosome partitioning or flagellar assembly